jgi:hypothetical protein
MSSQTNAQSSTQGTTPFQNLFLLSNPKNIITFLSLFSPIIVAFVLVCMSFIFQNFKGFVYLGFLLGVVIIRTYVYQGAGAKEFTRGSSMCDSVQYTKYGNGTFSSFVLAFTMMYLFIPMFMSYGTNYWVVTIFLVYFFADIFVKVKNNCVPYSAYLFLDVLAGAISASIIISLMYFGGSANFLFFNEMSGSAETCSMPSKQTFKCAVYKNGELVSNSVTTK